MEIIVSSLATGREKKKMENSFVVVIASHLLPYVFSVLPVFFLVRTITLRFLLLLYAETKTENRQYNEFRFQRKVKEVKKNCVTHINTGENIPRT